MTIEYKTAKRRHEPIPVKISNEDGTGTVEYTFNPPKRAGLVLPMLDSAATGDDRLRSQYEWLQDGFGEEQWDAMMARAKDPEDDFDTPDVLSLVGLLLEEMSGRPIG